MTEIDGSSGNPDVECGGNGSRSFTAATEKRYCRDCKHWFGQIHGFSTWYGPFSNETESRRYFEEKEARDRCCRKNPVWVRKENVFQGRYEVPEYARCEIKNVNFDCLDYEYDDWREKQAALEASRKPSISQIAGITSAANEKGGFWHRLFSRELFK